MGELSGRGIGALSVRSGFLIPRPSHPPAGPSSPFAMPRPRDALGGALQDAGNSRGRLAFPALGSFTIVPAPVRSTPVRSTLDARRSFSSGSISSFPFHQPLTTTTYPPLYSTSFVKRRQPASSPARSEPTSSSATPCHTTVTTVTEPHRTGLPVPHILVSYTFAASPSSPPPLRPLSFFCTSQIASPPPQSRP